MISRSTLRRYYKEHYDWTRKSRRFSKTERDAILQDLRKGTSNADLARKYDCSDSSISRYSRQLKAGTASLPVDVNEEETKCNAAQLLRQKIDFHQKEALRFQQVLDVLVTL